MDICVIMKIPWCGVLTQAKFLILLLLLNTKGLVQCTCSPPSQSFNFSMLPIAGETHHVHEVLFMGVVGPWDEKRVCKIKCIEGRWVGPLCSMEQNSSRFQAMQRPCHLHNIPVNTMVTYNNREVKPSPDLEFAHGTEVSAHCQKPGKFKLLGHSRLKCHNGRWDTRIPVCIHTNFFTNFSDDLPPALEWSVSRGAGLLDAAATLVLLPGTILHMDCLFPRLHGNPTWAWTPNYRQYPTGWAINRQERDLRYRLSLYYAKPEDSGMFTCHAPNGMSNFIHILVKGVKCPLISSGSLLKVEGNGVEMGATISFTCPTGYVIRGPISLTCMPSGSWSGGSPWCAIARCPPLRPQDPRLQVRSINATYTGTAVFSCVPGFRLSGPKYIKCTANGTWSEETPICREVHCPMSSHLEHGQISGAGFGKVGEFITYTCNPGFIIRGQSLAFCTQDGTWTHQPPKCVSSCKHPGDPENGRISPRRPAYPMNESIVIICHPGYHAVGPEHLMCLHTRQWSEPLTRCVPSLG